MAAVQTSQRMSLGVIFDAIRDAWSAETSVSPELWTESVPSFGQCAVTSLVLQDYVGGDLHRGLVQGVSHYWVETPSGDVIDLTRDQFVDPEIVQTGIRGREYLMSDSSTARRYRVLADAVTQRLRQHGN